MTTINTIEDLVRLLDEKPEWAEALRSRLQTRELLELPGKFESFRAEMTQAMADLARALTVTNERLDQAEEDRRDLRQVVRSLADAQAETNRRLDQAEEDRRDLRQTVMDLAQTVKGLADAQVETNRRLDQAEEDRRDLRQVVRSLADAQAETNRRLDRVEGNVQGLRSEFNGLRSEFNGLQSEFNGFRSEFNGLQSEFNGLRSEFNGLRDDFGPVKAAHVRNAALREVADIARSIGCTLVRVLGPEEVYDLHRDKDTSGISSDQLKSFRYGDLIIEATDINGSTCYLAVEVSYTVDKRDTSRSVRNAEFLTRFTGMPAFAGVAGVRFDDETAPGSDGVFLYQVYARNLEVD